MSVRHYVIAVFICVMAYPLAMAPWIGHLVFVILSTLYVWATLARAKTLNRRLSGMIAICGWFVAGMGQVLIALYEAGIPRALIHDIAGISAVCGFAVCGLFTVSLIRGWYS